MKALIALSILAVLPVAVIAQQRGTAGLSGRITDKQQAVIPGAKLALTQVARVSLPSLAKANCPPA